MVTIRKYIKIFHQVMARCLRALCQKLYVVCASRVLVGILNK
jgi:hypothetical protein